jgi:endo-1,4-beta-xylanase
LHEFALSCKEINVAKSEGFTTANNCFIHPKMIKAASTTSGVRFGCAVGNGYWNDSQCIKIIQDNCTAFVNENAFKWGEMESQRGHVDWSQVDKLIDFAQQHGGLVKLHNFFWHQDQPGWLQNLSGAELEKAMRERIQYTADHIKGKEYLIYGIDVVNEAIDDNGNLRNSLYSQKLGNNWVTKAYTMAREILGNNVKLIYNDYNMEYGGNKNNAVHNLVKDLKAANLVDEVGFQMHTVCDGHVNINNLKNIFKSYAEVGVKVNLSELDIRMNQGTRPSQDVLNKQGDYAYQIANALLSCGAARSILTWGITDRYSWLKGDVPLPFDYNYNAKPFKRGIERALSEFATLRETEVLETKSFEPETLVAGKEVDTSSAEDYEQLSEDDECVGDVCSWVFPLEPVTATAGHNLNPGCTIL